MATGTSRATRPSAIRAAATAHARPRLSLQIQHDPAAGALPVDRARIRRWVGSALERDAALVLRLVGTDEGRSLNGQYRSKDRPTNVLTFDYQQQPSVEADIVICLPVVRSEAREQRKTVADHLAHLVIHGVLHAHGYDHEDDVMAGLMEARETALLARYRIADPYRIVQARRQRPR